MAMAISGYSHTQFCNKFQVVIQANNIFFCNQSVMGGLILCITLIELASGDRQVSRHWQPIITGTAKARFRLQQQETYNGKQSQSITFISGEGEVGIDNAGLNRWGIYLQKGKSYEVNHLLRDGICPLISIPRRNSRG